MASEVLVATAEGWAELRGERLVVANGEGEVSVGLAPSQLAQLRRARAGRLALEVERKLRVLALPPSLRLDELEHQRLRQGYLLISEEASLRVRDKKEETRLTLKRGRGLEREELEIHLAPDQAACLWPLALSRSLEKVRYQVPDGDGCLELDVYEGPLDGLMTAEREFATRQEVESWSPPSWLGPDVTDDARYTNAQLVLAGAPPDLVST